MISEAVRRLDDSYTRRLTEEMIKIPSVVGDEAELAEYIRQELDRLGMETTEHMVQPKRPNIYGKLKMGDGKRLNFNGHTDTVPVVNGWETDPFTPVQKDDRLHGLGSCDMKAGIACTLNMVRAIIDNGADFKGELSVSAVIDEEAMGAGSKAMLETEYGNVDACVLAEPYPADESKPVPLGVVGKLLYDIHVHGVAAHGFRPEDGVNAIEDAGRILANLHKLDLKTHPKFEKGNFSTLKIEGGYDVYSVVVPAYCRFEVNRLIVPGETVEGAIADMEKLIESLDIESRVEVKIKPPMYESFEMNPEEPILKLFHGIYTEVMGVEPLYQYSKSITDANTLAGIGGIPCLHLGPKRGDTHKANEYVPLSWLPPVSEMYTRIAVGYLSQ
ncbi:M20/M25/M40 family metallo-hydrolase [Candidatus Bathyarchaeota archaeon]|nr:M20/M25/M40 family metallo-hydrolase [Candidatus Bathyarchaeota archaeon]